MDGDTGVVGRTLDDDIAHRGVLQALLEETTHLEIVVQLVGIGAALGIPDRGMVLDDTQADACRIDFLTHLVDSYFSATLTVMWQVRFRIRSARPWPAAECA